MTERPILFSASMVRAILADRKTQTRRTLSADLIAPEHGYRMGDALQKRRTGKPAYSPYGHAGDRLWVRENGWERPERTRRDMREGADTWEPYYFDADLTESDHDQFREWRFIRRPSIHMPRKVCRLVLEVTTVRVERLQSCNEADAQAEGTPAPTTGSYRAGYALLWDSLNAKRGYGWSTDPWVWVIEFRRANAKN